MTFEEKKYINIFCISNGYDTRIQSALNAAKNSYQHATTLMVRKRWQSIINSLQTALNNFDELNKMTIKK